MNEQRGLLPTSWLSIALVIVALLIAHDRDISTTSAYTTFQDDGAVLTQRTSANFVGTNVACADDSAGARTTCTLNDSVLFLLEQAAADADQAGYGQFWVKSDTPNVPFFTDDAGTDHQLLTGASNTRAFFEMPFESPTGTLGNWEFVEINASQDVHFNFLVPPDFESLIAANVVIIPDTTETVQWDVMVSVAADGEAYNNDDRSALNETQAVTINQLTDLDISTVLGALSAEDHVGIDFAGDTANIRIVGFEFEYD